jgi:hypothetical protein
MTEVTKSEVAVDGVRRLAQPYLHRRWIRLPLAGLLERLAVERAAGPSVPRLPKRLAASALTPATPGGPRVA